MKIRSYCPSIRNLFVFGYTLDCYGVLFCGSIFRGNDYYDGKTQSKHKETGRSNRIKYSVVYAVLLQALVKNIFHRDNRLMNQCNRTWPRLVETYFLHVFSSKPRQGRTAGTGGALEVFGRFVFDIMRERSRSARRIHSVYNSRRPFCV